MATRDAWQKHVERWVASELTAAQYGARAGVNPRTLVYWKWRLGRERRGVAAASTDLARFIEVQAVRDTGFEVELAGGRRVRVPSSFDAAALRRLLDVLEGAS